MKRTIGLVCEGPRDREIIEKLVDLFLPDDEVNYRYLQPDKSLNSANFNGWKGVLRWCRRDFQRVIRNNQAMEPSIDLIIIQMDGDVSRDEKNKQSHCICENTVCAGREQYTLNGKVRLEDCKEEKCPIITPCGNHEGSPPETYVSHIKNLVYSILGDTMIPVVVTIPCDSTDAWIVAAFDQEVNACEEIEKPWETVIAKKKDYHGIRINGNKKNRSTYEKLDEQVLKNWESVKAKCLQAKRFQEDIINVFHSQ